MSQNVLAAEILARKPKKRVEWVQKKLREETVSPGTHRDVLYEVLTRKEGKAFVSEMAAADVSRVYSAVDAFMDVFSARQQKQLKAGNFALRQLHLEAVEGRNAATTDEGHQRLQQPAPPEQSEETPAVKPLQEQSAEEARPAEAQERGPIENKQQASADEETRQGFATPKGHVTPLEADAECEHRHNAAGSVHTEKEETEENQESRSAGELLKQVDKASDQHAPAEEEAEAQLSAESIVHADKLTQCAEAEEELMTKRSSENHKQETVDSVQESTSEHKTRRLEDDPPDSIRQSDGQNGSSVEIPLAGLDTPLTQSPVVMPCVAPVSQVAPAKESLDSVLPVSSGATDGDASDLTTGTDAAQNVENIPSVSLSPRARMDAVDAPTTQDDVGIAAAVEVTARDCPAGEALTAEGGASPHVAEPLAVSIIATSLTQEPLQPSLTERAAEPSVHQEPLESISRTKRKLDSKSPIANITAVDSPLKEATTPKQIGSSSLRSQIQKAMVTESTIDTQSKPSGNDAWTSLLEQKRKGVLRLQLEEKQKELQELRARLLLRGRPPATAAGSITLSVSQEAGVAKAASAATVWVTGSPAARPAPPPPSFGAGSRVVIAPERIDVVTASPEESKLASPPPPIPSLPTKRKRQKEPTVKGVMSSSSENTASSGNTSRSTQLRGSLTLAAKLHAEHLDENRRKLAELVAARGATKKKNKQRVSHTASADVDNGNLVPTDVDDVLVGEVRLVAAVRDGIPLSAEEVRSGMYAAAKASGTLQPSQPKRRKQRENVGGASNVVEVVESDDDRMDPELDEVDYS